MFLAMYIYCYSAILLRLFSSSCQILICIHKSPQVDFVHYLVPDLKEITNCSFYWGKIDRYEAEKLLEGKPEGTFLLRDSAQEVTCFTLSI